MNPHPQAVYTDEVLLLSRLLLRFPANKLDQLACKHCFCRGRCMKVVELNEKCSRCQEVLNADEILPYDMALASEKSSNDDTVSANVTGVKIKLLIKELAELRKKDKTAKVLIFSQYVKTLNVLKKQLEKAGLKYRT